MQNQGFTNLMSRRKELSDRNKNINFYLQKWGGGESNYTYKFFFHLLYVFLQFRYVLTKSLHSNLT
jgi:hypothetical protein